MSMDQPYYKALKKANSKGAAWWAWGDSLYYLGLLGSIVSLVITITVYRFGSDYWPFILAVAIFLAGIFIISIPIKRYSYVIGERDGVDPLTYWKERSDENSI